LLFRAKRRSARHPLKESYKEIAREIGIKID